MIKAMMFAHIGRHGMVHLAVALVHGSNVSRHVLMRHAERHDRCCHPL